MLDFHSFSFSFDENKDAARGCDRANAQHTARNRPLFRTAPHVSHTFNAAAPHGQLGEFKRRAADRGVRLIPEEHRAAPTAELDGKYVCGRRRWLFESELRGEAAIKGAEGAVGVEGPELLRIARIAFL